MSSFGSANNESSRSTRRKKGASRPNFEQIDIDETFQFAGCGKNGKSGTIGDGYYVSTTINRKRYYGVLIPQEALKQASDIFFQDEALSLEINKRMAFLQQKQTSIKNEQDSRKGKKHDCGNQVSNQNFDETQQVQKFKYCHETKNTSGYRVILATFANILEASNGDHTLFEKIKVACDEGGNWVGEHYYQYEVKRNSLKALEDPSRKEPDGLFTSMSFNSFLLTTQLPIWYPLRNVYSGRAKILNMLNLKTNKCGLSTVKHNASKGFIANASSASTSRKHFRVAVIGAGLSGLGCAQELLRLSNEKNIPLEVVLIEARDRVGGRCCTDRKTFKTPSGNEFPVDLGACWIHGATGNPLAQLAQSVGLKMSKASENVKLLVGNMKEADENSDVKISTLFDEILDEGAQKCFTKDDMDLSEREQSAIRFYAQALENGMVDSDHKTRSKFQNDVAKHRYSSDSSVHISIRDIVAQKYSDMTQEESNLLSWNIKHTEYSFSANIDDLSMKYWDFDSQYAFEGPHLQLRGGYSTIAEAMLLQCKRKNNFKLSLNNPVKKIEYGLNSSTISGVEEGKQTISISDACRITIKDNNHHECLLSDFAVCTLPLGVLKSSQAGQRQDNMVVFEPPLPDYKTDCIEHVGFGILNKVYLQFPTSFWRKRDKKENLKGTPFLSDSEVNFGNASGIHSEYYMFFDVGFDHTNPGDPDNPNILHTLISGIDAVNAEHLSEDVIVGKVMKILRHLFSNVEVPEPKAVLITKWCSDNWSQGAYSFLAPGSCDQDYSSLQSPVCADGDFLHLGCSRTMRLFFAGEHTSSHYPSLAHGAYISGLRVAREIISNITLARSSTSDHDRLVPIYRYRQRYPEAPLLCSLCGIPATEKEGDLLSFQRDRRIVLVHRKCVLYSPDVSFNDGVWKNVIKCVNRGRQLRCVRCRKNGATIGCSEPTCKENYHFGCCDNEWSFEENGKGYFCVLHRKRLFCEEVQVTTDSSSALHQIQVRNSNSPFLNQKRSRDGGKDHPSEDIIQQYKCTPLSLDQYKIRNPLNPVVCALCKSTEKSSVCGDLLAFDRGGKQVLVHNECLKASNIIRISEDQKLFKVFDIINAARTCFRCYRDGATVRCNHPGCFRHYHYECAIKTNRKATFSKGFYCSEHLNPNQVKYVLTRKKQILIEPKQIEMGKSMLYSHDLFYGGSYRHDSSHLYQLKKRKRHYAPSNEFIMRKISKNGISSIKEENSLDNIASNSSNETSTRNSLSMVMSSPIQYHTSCDNIALAITQERNSKSTDSAKRVESYRSQTNKKDMNEVPTEIAARDQNVSKESRNICNNPKVVVQPNDIKAPNNEHRMIILVESDENSIKYSGGDANNPIILDDDSSLSD